MQRNIAASETEAAPLPKSFAQDGRAGKNSRHADPQLFWAAALAALIISSPMDCKKQISDII
jgi:hypothetical protein